MSGTVDNDSVIGNIPLLTLNVTGAGILAYVSAGIPVPTVEMSALSTPLAYVDGVIPAPSISASVLPGRIGSIDAFVPLPTLMADAGGYIIGAIPAPGPLISALAGGGGAIFGQIPVPTIVASHLTGTVVNAILPVPVPTGSSNAVSGTAGRVDARIPVPIVAASGYNGRAGAIVGRVPLPIVAINHAMGTYASFAASIPVPTAEIIGGPPVTVATTVEPRGATGTVSFCYVMNMKNFGLTCYAGFQADSIAVFNNKLIRADATGIWEQSAELDGTAYIDCAAKTGLSDLGDASKKRLPEIALDIRCDEQTRVLVSTDQGDEYTYRIERFNEGGMHQNRVKPGKGLKAKYFAIEVRNYRGDDLQLNAIRPMPFGIQRKVG